tara:strand:+ start:151 stop:492 length:342 start_codon:yes stop_codon:yes gene_type:complete
MSTLFKKIINKEIPSDIIYETEHILCFKDKNSVAPKHYLIIPKKEIINVNHLEDGDKILIGELFLAAKHVAKLLGIDKNGYRLVINNNDDAGQTVFHLHVHILGGRKLTWPPG